MKTTEPKNKHKSIDKATLFAIFLILLMISACIVVLGYYHWYEKTHHINEGTVTNKNHTHMTSRFGISEHWRITIKGKKNGTIVEYTFDVTKSEYDKYEIGDHYPKEY